jgi:hypothetical protein
MYVLFKVQLDVLVFFISLIVSSTYFGCYLHPSSGAQLQRTAIGVCMVLVCYPLKQVLFGTRDTLTLLARSVTDFIILYWHLLLALPNGHIPSGILTTFTYATFLNAVPFNPSCIYFFNSTC